MAGFEEQMDEAHQQQILAQGEPCIYKPKDSSNITTTVIFAEQFGTIEDTQMGESQVNVAVVVVDKVGGSAPIIKISEGDKIEIFGLDSTVQRIQKETVGRAILRIVRHIRKDISAQGSKTRRF